MHETLDLRRIDMEYAQLFLNVHDLRNDKIFYAVFTHYLRYLLNIYA
jgi:hypothetical protein